ncbi:malonyl-ACP O-methyltransferase BioC [Halopseudomonas salegens]|uniref:Malonyl-[acyl-carrier protein] O-methyltransferase n=1 Tax=Halopseudomonas salegens TaxID=1434072 RepID=A0A1H2EAJ0_9GAMM|nr:malonyl-ACP O-methyltransferase BioC [Halopseudomonas salegens]SDT92140.1 malonyl-CoA O-methyltransferase [Halopseudomonas salegens]
MSEAVIDKRQVAASFSRAASSYDQAAAFQRQVGDDLLAVLPAMQPRHVVDLGSGTGFFTRALHARYAAQVFGLDLAEGMVRLARQQPPAVQGWAVADAEHLPLRSASLDLLFSSLAVQWCPRLDQVLAEARRVLRPGGYLAFTTLVDGSLHELRQAWQAVDGFVHVNRFMPAADLQALLTDSGLRIQHCQVQPYVLQYQQLSELTRELKALGANNRNPGRPGGLTGRARLRALTQAYERFRQADGTLPATYQVAQVILQVQE